MWGEPDVGEGDFGPADTTSAKTFRNTTGDRQVTPPPAGHAHSPEPAILNLTVARWTWFMPKRWWSIMNWSTNGMWDSWGWSTWFITTPATSRSASLKQEGVESGAGSWAGLAGQGMGSGGVCTLRAHQWRGFLLCKHAKHLDLPCNHIAEHAGGNSCQRQKANRIASPLDHVWVVEEDL